MTPHFAQAALEPLVDTIRPQELRQCLQEGVRNYLVQMSETGRMDKTDWQALDAMFICIELADRLCGKGGAA